MNQNDEPDDPAESNAPPLAETEACPEAAPSLEADDPYSTMNQCGETEADPGGEPTLGLPPLPGFRSGLGFGPGTMLGDYELVRKIASGGMGTVWEARNTKNRLNLPVALKMIKAGDVATEADVQRFLIEARAVATLHSHPHIVKIYGIGNHGDQFYFAMQLVRGGSLKQKVAFYRADPKAAARLMIQVAGAIAHAHRRGILHRDLKPDNVLLDDQGNPFVTDFGLAKRVAPGAFSPTMAPVTYRPAPPRPAKAPGRPLAEEFNSNEDEADSILGTPSYMPPEQAKGQIKKVSTLSDVYGLGAILYELLTGRPPFVGSGPLDIIKRVIEEPIQPPRELDKGVDRDLQAVCLKALAKEPKDRYDSAEAFARDLQRWLELRPVHARPASPLTHAGKWVRREPLKAAVAAAIALVVALVPVGIVALQRASLASAMADAENAKVRAENAKALAEARAEKAEADRLAAEKDWAETSYKKSTGTIDAIVNAVESEIGAEPAMQPLRRKLLRLAVDHFKDAIAQWGQSASHVDELARAYGKKAEFADKLGDAGHGEARKGYEEAIRLLTSLLDARGETAPAAEVKAWKADLASYHHDLGIFFNVSSELDHALEQYLKGLGIREELCRCPAHGEPTCYDCLAAADVDLRAQLGRSHGYLGDVYLSKGQEKEGDAAYQTSHKIRLDLTKKFARSAEIGGKRADELKFQLARSFGNLAAFARYQGDLLKAIEYTEQATRLQRELIEKAEKETDEPDERDNRLATYLEDYSYYLRTHAEYLIEDHRHGEALPDLDTARDQYERLIALKPGRLKVYVGLARAALDRATVLLATEHPDEASKALDAAREIAAKTTDQRLDREYRVNGARGATLGGRIALALNKPGEAVKQFEAARDAFQSLAPEGESFDDYSDLGEAMADLGLAFERLGKRGDAVSWLKSALVKQAKALELAPKVGLTGSRLEQARKALNRLEPPSGTGGPGR